MKKILCATSSEPKIKYFKDLMKDLDIEVMSPSEIGLNLTVVESGTSAEENALIKASTYHHKTGYATIALDSALYFNEFDESDSRQPGVHVRRIKIDDQEMTDLEMIELSF